MSYLTVIVGAWKSIAFILAKGRFCLIFTLMTHSWKLDHIPIPFILGKVPRAALGLLSTYV